MRALVAIASYGTGNDEYLHRVLAEYASMPYRSDLVVFSNVRKTLPPGVHLEVGLPTANPWSLPFAHKSVFADRANDYDLFIYSEDDILVTKRNIEAFLRLSSVLPEDEIAGFLRFETDGDGSRHYPDVHSSSHWDPHSVERIGGHTFAFFTCEHAACYAINRQQLLRALDSGGFLVEPHEGKYDLACTAATDIYTQCGFKKMICISGLEDILVKHLSNRYFRTPYSSTQSDFDSKVEALFQIQAGERERATLLRTETRLPLAKWSKNYYEPTKPEILELLSEGTKKVLSVGCGWGELEGAIVRSGIAVVGVPLDSVIAACAEARGVGTLSADWEKARGQLEGQVFDCVITSNILHLLKDPGTMLLQCIHYLRPGGRLIVVEPNFRYLKVLWNVFLGKNGDLTALNFEDEMITPTTQPLVRQWLKECQLHSETLINSAPSGMKWLSSLGHAFVPDQLSPEFVMSGLKSMNANTARVTPSAEVMNFANDDLVRLGGTRK